MKPEKTNQLGVFVRAWRLLGDAVMGRGTDDYTSGPIGRAVLLLAIPMVLEMSMESVFAVVDIFFVARLGADAVAAVGLTEAVITILFAIAIGLSMGVTALVARRIGEGHKAAAGVVAGQAIWIGIFVSVVIGTGGIVLGAEILRLMGAEEAVIAGGVSYTQILLGGCITIVFLFLLNAVFRGAGDASLAMRTLWLANGINIVLDPLLIYGIGPFPEMGVAGAATATNIGRGTGVLYQLWCLTNGAGVVTLGLTDLRLSFSIIWRLLRVSFGGILQFLIATSSWVILMRIVSPYGAAAIAGYTIGVRMLAFTFLPAWGLGNAAATLVGQNLGAGKPDRAERSVWRAAKYNMIFLALVAAVMIAYPAPLVRLFTQEPDVLLFGADCLRIIAYGYVFYAVGMVLTQAFNGAGDTYTPTWINVICFWIIQVPTAFALAEFVGLGPQGVFYAVAIGESLIAVIAFAVFRRGTWKLKLV
jgi:putative MATE family efflux protein